MKSDSPFLNGLSFLYKNGFFVLLDSTKMKNIPNIFQP